jgi:sigma-E factor negative regulatory protein RseC
VLETSGTVIAVEAGQVVIATEARSACAHCAASGCTGGVLAQLFPARRNRVRLDNTIDAALGERVIVGLPDSVLVRASLLVYLVPVAGMILAAATAGHAGLGAAGQAGAALLGLLAGLASVGLFAESRVARRRYRARLLRVVRPQPVRIEALTLNEISK